MSGDDLALPYDQRKVNVSQMLQDEAQKVWQEYRALPQRTRY
ncbi:hypothetical protein [Verticiella alkaliphila]|nr:hypothetical protein [Verticiella sp. GG226]